MNIGSKNTLATIMLGRIRANKKITINGLIAASKQQDFKIDKNINTDLMLKWGFADVIEWHWKGGNKYPGCIEPNIKIPRENSILNMWLDDTLESDEDWKIFDSIEWNFTKNGLNMYMNDEVKDIKISIK